MDRRKFLAAAPLGAATPLVLGAAPGHAQSLREGSLQDVPDAQLQALMHSALSRELADEETAQRMVEWIWDVGFEWHAETAPVAEADFIIAFAFGNRPPANGGDPAKVRPEPGPTNEALAYVISKLRQERRLPVYAQWEIAQVLAEKHHMDHVVSIEPEIAEDGTIKYLSTDDIAKKVAELRRQEPDGPGVASVVGFHDHLKRCVLTTRANDMMAYAPLGYAMPNTYDQESGQVWTRYRPVYLVVDMAGQLALLQRELVEEATPDGG
ncbi:hypothetical protein [Saccharopolyspora elongata]|uniref:Uncharacterized protein n=1 Tax=Saccharopolyspora elongata TaxID=2530387 RepID=A0A4R4YWS0_9PSEU|nr:hypothetical protein [Saccharopolyspora elongata]TDD48102.1 hypothetical protein E1288_22610 [Saccharopolyspora elongata]